MKNLKLVMAFLVIFTLLIPIISFGEGGFTNDPSVTFEWTPPTDTDILYYKVEISRDYGVTWSYTDTTNTPTYTYLATSDGPVNIQMKAVDWALNESAIWSPSSDTVGVDQQIPGGCGAGVWRPN